MRWTGVFAVTIGRGSENGKGSAAAFAEAAAEKGTAGASSEVACLSGVPFVGAEIGEDVDEAKKGAGWRPRCIRSAFIAIPATIAQGSTARYARGGTDVIFAVRPRNRVAPSRVSTILRAKTSLRTLASAWDNAKSSGNSSLHRLRLGPIGKA